MKVKLLKKIRARFKIVKHNGSLNLLDLKQKQIVHPFLDWTTSVRNNYKRYMFKTVLGDKKYEALRIKHHNRKHTNACRQRYEELLKS